MSQDTGQTPINEGDILASVYDFLLQRYRPLNWAVTLADTPAGVLPALSAAADGAALVMLWGGDDSAETQSPITRADNWNILNIVLKQRSITTPEPHKSLVKATAGRDSYHKTLGDVRKVLLSLRWTMNGKYPFDNDQRGPVFSRLRYMGTKPFMQEAGMFDAYQMNFRFIAPMDMPDFDETNTSDKIPLEIRPQGALST